MAVSVLHYVFYGLSSDVKPTVVPGGAAVNVGSRFIEVDTGNQYDWGGSSWALTVVASSTVAVTGALPAGSATIGATQDAGPVWTTVWGVSNAPVASADMSAADADLLPAPTSGQKWVITDVIVSADTAMRVDVKEETSGTVMFSGYVTAGGWNQLTPRGKRKLATTDKKAVGRTSAAGNVRILLGAYSEA